MTKLFMARPHYITRALLLKMNPLYSKNVLHSSYKKLKTKHTNKSRNIQNYRGNN